MATQEDLEKKIERLRSRCIGLATWQGTSYQDYENARDDLMTEPSLLRKLPEWLVVNRWGGHFWKFIKEKYPTYQERREFLNAAFDKLAKFVKEQEIAQTSATVEEILQRFSCESIQEAWERASQRRTEDPEGAITAARTMLESTCKFILDELGQVYSDKDDLPKLYKIVASVLKLSPGGHNEQIFKQILGGCTSVVEGLGAVRNVYGDAHGKGRVRFRPSSRHADIAVNLAGSLSAFLLSTFEDRTSD